MQSRRAGLAEHGDCAATTTKITQPGDSTRQTTSTTRPSDAQVSPGQRLWRLPEWPKSRRAELALFREWGKLQSLAATLTNDGVLPDMKDAGDLLDFVVSFPGDMLVLIRDSSHPLFFLSRLRGPAFEAWTRILLAEEVQIQLMQIVRTGTAVTDRLEQWTTRFAAELSDQERHQLAFDPAEWEAVRHHEYHDNGCLRALDPQSPAVAGMLYVTGHLFAVLYAGVLNDDFDYATEEPWRVFGRAVAMLERFPDLNNALVAATDSDSWAPLRDFILSFHGVRADNV